MKKAIIFGCGAIGTNTFLKIKEMYNVIAWSDNNEKLWGKQKEGIEIINPQNISVYIGGEEVIIFVAVAESNGIVKQLYSYSLSNIYIWKSGYFYYNSQTFQALRSISNVVINKSERDKCILFIVNSVEGAIREHKRASILKDAGYRVFLAHLMPYLIETSRDYINIYEQVFTIMSLDELMELANNSVFDLIHSSSEPEWVSNILSKFNKPLIHECHDLGSANKAMSPEQLAIEYISHVSAKGVVYPTDKLRQDAIKKFGIPVEKTVVIENLISEKLVPAEKKEKLSKTDGCIHAVYEGAITKDDKTNKRYFEDIWLVLAKEGIHVHFYTNHDLKYCLYLDSLHENIHYEGNLSSNQLAIEMSQYDLGLLLFNVNKTNKLYLESASPNKMYEYINVGIPIATYGINIYREFIESNNLGKEIIYEEPIYSQFEDIKGIKIPERLLQKKGLLLEYHTQEILDFIDKCMK